MQLTFKTLQDAVTTNGFIVGDGSNFVLETATARTSLGLGTMAT